MGAVGRSPWCRWFQVLLSLWGHLADKNWPTHMQTARRDLCGGGLHSCSTTGEEIQSANHEASWAPTASYRHLSPIPPTPAFFLSFFLYLVVGVMSQALGNLDCADIVDEKEPNQQKVYSTEIHRPWTINEWQAPQKRETHYLLEFNSLSHSAGFPLSTFLHLLNSVCWNVFPTVLFSVSWRSFSVAWIEAFYMLWVFCW